MLPIICKTRPDCKCTFFTGWQEELCCFLLKALNRAACLLKVAQQNGPLSVYFPASGWVHILHLWSQALTSKSSFSYRIIAH